MPPLNALPQFDTNTDQIPPVLPPKINNVNSRQRRHSDTVTTVTEGSPDLLNDPIVQERLRPRNNSVTNALYDRYFFIGVSLEIEILSFLDSLIHAASLCYFPTDTP